MACISCMILDDVKKMKQSGNLEEAEKTISHLINSLLGTGTNRCYKDREEVCRLCKLDVLYNERGQIHYLMVNFNEAIDDYTTAIDLNPFYGVAYYNRGQIHYRMGRFAEAICDMKQAVAVNEKFEDALEALRCAEKEQFS